MAGRHDEANHSVEASHRLKHGWSRRGFLQTSAAAAGLLVAGNHQARAAEPTVSALTDVNVSFARWPLRRLPWDEPDRLVAELRAHSVTQAWAGTLDGLLHKDLAAANARLAADCQRYGAGMFRPFGSINPALPDWREELRRCVEVHRMPGIRLHPNYHGYRLTDPRFEELLERAAGLELVVQLALVMEDERMMHPLLRVEPVDPTPLTTILPRLPALRLVLLNALRTLRGSTLASLLDAGNVSVELAMLEGVGGVENLLGQVPAGRVLFGSHAPLFYFAAAELKLRESLLTPDQDQAIRHENARRLLDPLRRAAP